MARDEIVMVIFSKKKTPRTWGIFSKFLSRITHHGKIPPIFLGNMCESSSPLESGLTLKFRSHSEQGRLVHATQHDL